MDPSNNFVDNVDVHPSIPDTAPGVVFTLYGGPAVGKSHLSRYFGEINGTNIQFLSPYVSEHNYSYAKSYSKSRSLQSESCRKMLYIYEDNPSRPDDRPRSGPPNSITIINTNHLQNHRPSHSLHLSLRPANPSDSDAIMMKLCDALLKLDDLSGEWRESIEYVMNSLNNMNLAQT